MSPMGTVKKIANTTGGSYVMLFTGLLISVGPWVLSLDTWGAAVSTQNIGVLLPIVGGVLMAWLGKSPGTN